MQKIKTFLLQVLGIVYIIFLAFSAYFAITSLNVIFEFAHIDVSISSMLFKEKSLSYMFWSYQIEDGFWVYVLLRGVLNPLMIFAGFQTIAYLVTLLIKFLCRFIKNEKNKNSTDRN